MTILFAKLTVHFFNKVTGGGANTPDSERLTANLGIWVGRTPERKIKKFHSYINEIGAN